MLRAVGARGQSGCARKRIVVDKRGASGTLKLDGYIPGVRIQNQPERIELRALRVAELLGISPGNLHDLTSGRTWPNRDVALRIRTLTHGEVTPNDFVPPMRQPAETASQKRKTPRKKTARPLQSRRTVRRVAAL